MTNRERLREIITALEEIQETDAIGPSAYTALQLAIDAARRAGQHALDERERAVQRGDYRA